VTVTVKHFAGYSESINGHDRVQADLPIRYLQDQFLPSYAGAIRAGAGTVMVDAQDCRYCGGGPFSAAL
jgi:beta-glucosidase